MEAIVIAATVAGSATIVAATINAVGNVKAAKLKLLQDPAKKPAAASDQIRVRRSFGWQDIVVRRRRINGCVGVIRVRLSSEPMRWVFRQTASASSETMPKCNRGQRSQIAGFPIALTVKAEVLKTAASF